MSDTMIDPSAEATPEPGPETENTEAAPASEDSNIKTPQTEESSPDVPADSGQNADDSLFFGKYKSYEEAEKGFKELQSKLREKTPDAPEEYNFDLSKDENLVADLGEDIVNEFNPKDDPRFEAMQDVFKKHNLSQDVVDDIVKTQIRFDMDMAPDLEAEANALGDNRDTMLENANHFVQKHLNEDEQQIAVELGRSANGVKLLYKMSQMVGEKQIPAQVNTADAGPSSSELYKQAFAYRDEIANFDMNKGAQTRYDEMLSAAIRREELERQGK